jgi:hypothetical protein
MPTFFQVFFAGVLLGFRTTPEGLLKKTHPADTRARVKLGKISRYYAIPTSKSFLLLRISIDFLASCDPRLSARRLQDVSRSVVSATAGKVSGSSFSRLGVAF